MVPQVSIRPFSAHMNNLHGARWIRSGETIEYGSRVQRGPVETDVAYEDAAAIMPLDVDGKIVYTIPANLKLLSECAQPL